MRPELGSQVKALAISQFDAESLIATRFDPDEELSMGRILGWEDTYQVAALLDLLPNLQI
jgi:hypothetical protein